MAVDISQAPVNDMNDINHMDNVKPPTRPVYEQPPLTPLMLDISGDPEVPVPQAIAGSRCACCGLWTEKLWQGARAGFTESHAVCTLCYLAGHLDSPTAAHGRLAYVPGLLMSDVQHLQRRALIAMLTGTKTQRYEGQRITRWLWLHTREVEQAWGTSRAVEFAKALKQLAPYQRVALQTRLASCALMLPADLFDDLSLLLPTGKSPVAALTSRSWDTYTRSDLYVEPDTLG